MVRVRMFALVTAALVAPCTLATGPTASSRFPTVPPPATDAFRAAFRALPVDRPALRAAALATGEAIIDGIDLGDRTVRARVHPRAAAAAQIVAASIDPITGAISETELPQPSVTLLRGDLDGEPGSRVFIAVDDHGMQGYVVSDGRTFIVSSGPPGAGLPTLIYEVGKTPAELLEITVPGCDAESLEGYPKEAIASVPAEGGVAGATCRAVQIAIETDHEFLADLFAGSTADATNYIYTLLGASSEIYEAQLATRLEVSFIRFWPSAGDPWEGGSTSAQLYQFRDLWNIGMTWLPRDLGHFLSGRPLGGGVAWLSAICAGDYGYGLSANLNGSFPYPIEDHNSQNWDLMVVSHELGHNFGSPHTHSYAPPLDGCGNGDCSQAWGGTIMSYCHTCPGGMSNMIMEFHPENVNTMNAFLGSIGCPAAGAPGSAGADAVTALAGIALSIDVLANDFSGDCTTPAVASFPATTPAGATLGLGVDGGADGRDQLVYSAPTGFVGVDAFTYEALLSGGEFVPATVTVTVAQPRQPDMPASVFDQLAVSFYALDNPSVLPDFAALTPYATATASPIMFPSTDGVFIGSGLADNVGAVFEGYLYAPKTDLYTLYLESDDGSRLVIGSTVVVVNDGLHGMVEQSGTIALAEGGHSIRIEFFEAGGGAGLIARWKTPTTSKVTIPPYRLFHAAGGNPADLNGDGVVNGADLGVMLGAWGACPPPPCVADLTGDGTVDGADLGVLLGAWG